MADAHGALDTAIAAAERLRLTLRKNSARQVRSAEERDLVKANCLAWFNSHRPVIQSVVAEDLLVDADGHYKALLAATDNHTIRTRYDSLLKQLKVILAGLRGYAIAPAVAPDSTPDTPPAFDALVSDTKMRDILTRRWFECTKCIDGGAALAATVMMGGLLESLLLARVNRETDKSKVFQATSAPRDKATTKTLPLQEWTLRNYIDVAHELEWITRSAKDVGEVVRDYRNYVHPHKELQHGIILNSDDAHLFWEITKSMARQVLASASKI